MRTVLVEGIMSAAMVPATVAAARTEVRLTFPSPAGFPVSVELPAGYVALTATRVGIYGVIEWISPPLVVESPFLIFIVPSPFIR
jgi:hypothetical protein